MRAAEEDGLHAVIQRVIIGEEHDQVAEMAARKARIATNDLSIHSCITTEADIALQAAISWAEVLRSEKKNDNYFRILNDKFARLYFLTLSRMPAHFRNGKDLTMKTVLARHDTGHMGVSDSYATS